MPAVSPPAITSRRSRPTPRATFAREAEQAWTVSSVMSVRLPRGGEPAQRLPRHASEDPVATEPGAERFVELDRRRVPVEHGPLHAAAAALAGQGGQRSEQGPARAAAALVGPDEEILEVERGTGEERRVRVEVQGEADGLALALAQEGLEVPPRPEPVTA